MFQAELIRKQGDPQNYYVNEYFGSSLPQESPRNNRNKRKSKKEHFPEKNIEVITKKIQMIKLVQIEEVISDSKDRAKKKWDLKNSWFFILKINKWTNQISMMFIRKIFYGINQNKKDQKL